MKDELGRITKPASESGFYDVLFEVSVPAFDIKSSIKHLVLLNKFFELFSCLRFTVFVFKEWVENFEVNLENSIWIRYCAIINSWNLLPCSVHKMSVKVVERLIINAMMLLISSLASHILEWTDFKSWRFLAIFQLCPKVLLWDKSGVFEKRHCCVKYEHSKGKPC